jgi:hypothetical protein
MDLLVESIDNYGVVFLCKLKDRVFDQLFFGAENSNFINTIFI